MSKKNQKLKGITPLTSRLGTPTSISVGNDKVKIDGKVIDTTNFENIKVDGDISSKTLVLTGTDATNDTTINFGGDELFFINKNERVVTFKHISGVIPSFIVHGQDGSEVDFFSLLCSSNGATTLSTTDGDGSEADLTLTADGFLKLQSASGEDITLNVGASGEIVIQENGGTYTPTADGHIATKKYVDDNAGGGSGDMTGVDLTGGTGISIDSETNTTSGDYSATITCNLEGTEVVSTGEGGGTKFLREDGDGTCSWNEIPIQKNMILVGGQQPRNLNSAGTHRAISTGYDGTNLSLGNGTDPATSLTVSTTGDHANNRLISFHEAITVTGCTFLIAEGGATNTTSNLHLMRYDVDSDGDWSNGVVVAQGTNSNSDDYSHQRRVTMSLSGTSSNLDVSTSQSLVACIESVDAVNTFQSVKVLIQYTWS